MEENDCINFKVELLDANTNEVLGLYDNITFKKDDFEYYENIQYEINSEGIGTRDVKLRLKVDDNLNGGYSFSTIKADNSVFAKTTVPKVINFQGSLQIKDYQLSQNYPNPFNPSTTIKYEIPKEGIVSLKVYDILGREVTTLVNKHQNIGRYEVKFNASSLSTGVYIYRLTVSDPSAASGQAFTESRKMILMK